MPRPPAGNRRRDRLGALEEAPGAILPPAAQYDTPRATMAKTRDSLTHAGRFLFKTGVPRLVRSSWSASSDLLHMLDRERKYGGKAGLGWLQRIALWRAGFLSESAVIYGSHDPRRLGNYMSDLARFRRTGTLNGPFDVILHDKLCFWGFMRNFSERIAPALGIVWRGKLVRLGVPDAEPVVTGLPRLGGKLVLKPRTGSGGAGVIVYERRDGGAHLVNGAEGADADLPRELDVGEAYIVGPYIDQAGYARDIFPDVANTVRVLTMYDEEAGEAFAAAAAPRFGARRAGSAVDNWGQGGISAGIDLASGCLTRGYGFPFQGELRPYPAHPDTGAAIEGAAIPDWPRVRDGILDLAGRLPFLPYVGWDVIIT